MKIYQAPQNVDDIRYEDLQYLCFEWVRTFDEVTLFIEDDEETLLAAGSIGKLKSDPKVALIHYGMVHPDHRRKGLHTKLMEERIRIAREWGCTKCVATSYGPVTNSARNLKRFGFREEAWLPHGPFDATTEWVLDLT